MMPACSRLRLLVCFVMATPSVAPASTRTPNSLGVERSSPSAIVRTTEAADRRWGLQLGASFISRNNIGEILSGDIARAKNDSGGQAYSLSLSWVAHRFQFQSAEKSLRPQFEPYLTLTVVDETADSPFLDYNGGVGFRWVDFPWERWIRTSFFTGVGLSYSTKVFAVDRERHPGVSRSHLKLDWPLQLTFALPSLPEHQLVLFNDHQSGGHIFDEGGVNSLGIGYRWEF